MRAAVAAARRHEIIRPAAAWSSQSTGAGAIISNAVAFGEPTVAITSERIAASRQPPRPAARTVRATIQPRPAHGRSIKDVRDT